MPSPKELLLFAGAPAPIALVLPSLFWKSEITMSKFPLKLEEIYEDLAAIEASGMDTAFLADLVKDVGAKPTLPPAGSYFSIFLTLFQSHCSCSIRQMSN